MAPNPTVGQLVSAGVVSTADVEAAVTAYLAAPDPGIVPLRPNHEVDITAAIAAHSFATRFLNSGRTGKSAVRAAVRSATLSARAMRR